MAPSVERVLASTSEAKAANDFFSLAKKYGIFHAQGFPGENMEMCF